MIASVIRYALKLLGVSVIEMAASRSPSTTLRPSNRRWNVYLVVTMVLGFVLRIVFQMAFVLAEMRYKLVDTLKRN